MNPVTKTLTVTQAKRRFLEIVEAIESSHEMVTLTRKGIPATIMMSVDDFEAMLETIEILSDPGILAALKKSRRQARGGELLSDAEVWG